MDQNNEPSKIVFEGEQFQRPRQSFQTPTHVPLASLTFAGSIDFTDVHTSP